MKIKICGITNASDAVASELAGADFLGIIFEPSSSRCVSLELGASIASATKGSAKLVGVFVSQDANFICRTVSECGLFAVQLHGEYSPEFAAGLDTRGAEIWKAFWLDNEGDVESSLDFPCGAVLADSRSSGRVGGTGTLSNWKLAKRIATEKKLVLAGGLNPENAGRAAAEVSPWCMDFNSGVELSPRAKDIYKIEKVMKELK